MGPGHPAGAYCLSVGGKIFSLKGEEGSNYEMCTFDRGMIEVVTLWYTKRVPELAVKAFQEHIEVSIPAYEHPANYYCTANGGKVVIGLDSKQNQWGLCQFSEQGHLSLIDGWTLFRGPNDPLNAGLVKALSL